MPANRKKMVNDLLNRMENGSVSALARLITLVENDHPQALKVLQSLYPKTGHAYIIGITGPPGSGKSTLTDKIAKELRQRDFTIGIVAVDPSSPFSGGALLGDRLRMQEMAKDDGIFFRSMATRGTMGGLARTTSGITALLDAFGKDYILIETVGVGQDELDVVQTADSTLLVSVPGLGDEIQALKAGIMEIGDIYIVNKADRNGAQQLASELQAMRDLKISGRSWLPPIVQTVAVEGDGIVELTEGIMAHRRHIESNGSLRLRRNERVKEIIAKLIEKKISEMVKKILRSDRHFEETIQEIMLRNKDPYTYVQEVIAPFVQYVENYKIVDVINKRVK